MHSKDEIRAQSTQYIAKMTKFLIDRRKFVTELNKPDPNMKVVKGFKKNLSNVIFQRVDLRKGLQRKIQ
jgi:hypothetical protein